MNDGEKMEEKEIIRDTLNSIKREILNHFEDKKIKVKLNITRKREESKEFVDHEDSTIATNFTDVVVYVLENNGVVFDEENGTKFFVLYKDMEINLCREDQLKESSDAGIKVIVQNAVID